MKLIILQRLHYFQIIMDIVVQFSLCWNLDRHEFQMGMNKWEESGRCKLYFILFLNKGIACRNIRTVNTIACAAGSQHIKKLSDQLCPVLFINPTISKCLPWIYFRIICYSLSSLPKQSFEKNVSFYIGNIAEMILKGKRPLPFPRALWGTYGSKLGYKSRCNSLLHCWI